MTQIGEFVLCANCKGRLEQTFELEIPKLRDLLAQIEALYNAQNRDWQLAIFPLLALLRAFAFSFLVVVDLVQFKSSNARRFKKRTPG